MRDGTMKVVKFKGPVVTAVVASLAMAGVVGAFVSNASPYVTIAEAKTVGGDRLQLYGEISERSRDFSTGHTVFTLKDKTGATVRVENVGTAPASFMEADHAVAIGSMQKDGRFLSHELLVKCPSKYGEKKAPTPLAQTS